MIYRGLQARLLHDREDGCLPENDPVAEQGALGGRHVIVNGTVASAQPAHERWMTTQLDRYGSNVRADAERRVRRGAVEVKVQSASDDGCSVDQARIQPFSLAFRWVGSQYNSARKAHELDDLASARLIEVQALSKGPEQAEINDHASSSQSCFRGSFGEKFVRAMAPSKRARRRSIHSILRTTAPSHYIEQHLRRHAKTPTNEEFPLFAQVFVDGESWLVAPSSVNLPQVGEATVTFGCRGGAFIAFPSLKIDEIRAQEGNEKVMHTVTIHVWNGLQNGLRKHSYMCECTGDDEDARSIMSLDRLGIDPQLSHAPDAIFHFELVALAHSKQPALEHIQPAFLQPAQEQQMESIVDVKVSTSTGSRMRRISAGERTLSDVQEESNSSHSAEANITAQRAIEPSQFGFIQSSPTSSPRRKTRSECVSIHAERASEPGVERRGLELVRDETSAPSSCAPPQDRVVDLIASSSATLSASNEPRSAFEGTRSELFPPSDANQQSSRLAALRSHFIHHNDRQTLLHTAEANDGVRSQEASTSSHVVRTSKPKGRWTNIGRRAKLPTQDYHAFAAEGDDGAPAKSNAAADPPTSGQAAETLSPLLIDNNDQPPASETVAPADLKDCGEAPDENTEVPPSFANSVLEEIEKRLKRLSVVTRTDTAEQPVTLADIVGEAGSRLQDKGGVGDLASVFEGLQKKKEIYSECVRQRDAVAEMWRARIRAELHELDSLLSAQIEAERRSAEAMSRYLERSNGSKP